MRAYDDTPMAKRIYSLSDTDEKDTNRQKEGERENREKMEYERYGEIMVKKKVHSPSQALERIK